jgi:hypothetical protein
VRGCLGRAMRMARSGNQNYTVNVNTKHTITDM